MNRWHRLLLTLIAVGLVAPASAGAVNARTATDLYLGIRDALRVPSGWTGDAGSCEAGSESRQSVAATLTAVNGMRRFAGLRPVRFDAALNRKALEAALMMRAANANSHFPGPEWPCYTQDGADAAGTSNLYQGESGAGAMVGYVEDLGVPSLGHRRWVLDPRGVRWGTGSTGATNALLVAGANSRSDSSVPVPAVVSWPPPGSVPWPLVFEDWSASFAARDTDLSTATVAVKVDGEPRAVTGVTDLGTGFGEGRTLAWRVSLTASDRARPRRVSVKITYGASKSVSYTVDTLAIGAPRPPRDPKATWVRGGIRVTWKAAQPLGVPVTGYRINGTAGPQFPEVRRRVGPGVREVVIPYKGERPRFLTMHIIALSRLGGTGSARFDVKRG